MNTCCPKSAERRADPCPASCVITSYSIHYTKLYEWRAFADDWPAFFAFIGFGALALVAAVTYTVGRRPYGYRGLGDLSVFLFFGLLGVVGSFYLFTRHLSWPLLLPATGCGLLATAVLNT